MRKLLLRLPPPVRHPIMRRLFRFEPDRCERFEVREARTGDEYLQAFRLVGEAYEANGFFRTGEWPRQSEGRVYFPQVALPTSTVLVVLDGGKVVGTTTLVRDSALGLPGAKLIEEHTKRLGARGERLSELSMLAVAPAYRRSGEVLFALLRYAALFQLDYERVDLTVSTTNPVLADALRGLMLFHAMWEKPRPYPLSKTPIIGVWVDYTTIEARARRMYAGTPRHRDLARFFFDDGRARVRFPPAPWRTTLLPKLPPSEFPRAFGTPEDFRANGAERHRLVVRNAYPAAFRAALPEYFPPVNGPERETRYDADVPTVLSADAAKSVTAKLSQVSAHGALVTTGSPLRVGETVSLEVAFAPERVSYVSGKVVRVANPRQYGLAIAAPDAVWGEYVRFLEEWLWGPRAAPAAQPLAG